MTEWKVTIMLKEPRIRTEKVFEEYNDYHDRGMVKWLTAFAMEELAKSIAVGKDEAMKDIPILPQMSPIEIDTILSESIQKSCLVSIQLNQKDRFERQTESIVGHFKGYLTDNKLLIDNEWVLPESIRNVRILNDEKWSKTHVFSANSKEKNGLNSTRKFPNTVCIEDQEAFETDITWVEDFNQCTEWFE